MKTKYCETCGKVLEWGGGFTVNGVLQCEDCMRAEIRRKLNQSQPRREETEQPQQQTERSANLKEKRNKRILDTVFRQEEATDWLRGFAKGELICGILFAVIGLIAAFINEMYWWGLVILFCGVNVAIFAWAILTAFANMAERQEEMRVLLAQQLELQKNQLQQPAPPQA